jgi:PAS domain S-box-containing protein
MPESFVILCCENIRPEVDAVLATGAFRKAIARSFPFHCGHVRSVWETIKSSYEELEKTGAKICLLGCGCGNAFDIPREILARKTLLMVDSGPSLFLPEKLLEHYQREGQYIKLPGRLLKWKQNAACNKLSQTTAQEMFEESVSGILILDTGVYPDFAPVIAAFADYYGRPAKTLPVGIDHLRLLVAEQYLRWQYGQDITAGKNAVSSAEKRVADYSMVADLTGTITGMHDERAIILQMLDLIVLLSSPKRAGFLPVLENGYGEVISVPPDAYSSAIHFQRIFDPAHPYYISESSDSFLFQVKYNENLIGILSVDKVSLPEALDEYLNLSHFIAQVAGLSITIARTHQNLVETIAERDTEIAERKKIQAELSLHSEILQNMAEGVALVRTQDGTIVFTNSRFTTMFGYDEDELPGKNVAILNAPDTRSPEEIAREITLELEMTGIWTGEVRNRRKDGREFWCHATVSTYNHPVFGNVWITVHEDITERKLIENALAGTEQRYHQLYEGMRDAFASIDLDGRITGFNPAFEKMIGFDSDEIYTLTFHDLTPEKWHAAEEEILKNQVLKRGYSDIYEKEYRQKNGSVIPVELRVNLIVGEGGIPQGMWAIIRDITQRKMDQKALQESEERYRTIIENIEDVYFQFDGENHLVLASPSAAHIFGYASAEEMKGIPAIAIWKNPDLRADFLETMRKQGGSVQDWESEYVRKDGTTFWGSISARLRSDEQGNYAGTEGIIRDISERKKIEEALKGAIRKLNMLSSITRHDILNQVMGLRTFLELSREDLKGTKFAAYIEKEDQAAEAIQRQIEFTKYYQDIGVNAPKWQDAKAVISEALAQLKPAGIEVQITVSGIEIFADPLIVKVFFNLMENSLRHGERVTWMSFSSRESGSGIAIIYEDNGVGITANDKKQLFRKGFGKHTGLGLFLSQEILAITDISITENGEPGKGVRFEITFPKEGYHRTG